jgi:hypothetical protein
MVTVAAQVKRQAVSPSITRVGYGAVGATARFRPIDTPTKQTWPNASV